MPKFHVAMYQLTLERTDITVEAATSEEARAITLAMNEDKLEWLLVEVQGRHIEFCQED